MRRGSGKVQESWKKVPEIKIKASDGTKVNVANPLPVVEDVVVAPHTKSAAISPSVTDHSDYTVSSASVDEKAADNNPELQIKSFSGILGQWDMVENAGCIVSVPPLWNKKNNVTLMCPAVNVQSAFCGTCSSELRPSRQDSRSSNSEHFEALCWPLMDEMNHGNREDSTNLPLLTSSNI